MPVTRIILMRTVCQFRIDSDASATAEAKIFRNWDAWLRHYPVGNRITVQYWTILKEIRVGSRSWVDALSDVSEVLSEFILFDDEKAILVRLYQTKVMKSLHKKTDARTRRAHHLG